MWTIKARHVRDVDGGTAALELQTDDRLLDVNVRWDGCMEIHMYSRTEENRELKDMFHTCDLKALIETLTSLDGVCQDYFREGTYWERDPEEELQSHKLETGFVYR
ncbi:hypothetical protein [Cohnella kolymensis]|uniref:hypothetical protein n=1 Tax=Cohnella kolymensis TaxID=1590652 RepID=UPI000698DF5E|nr:hypothetical protein [Cohnella kolymensis]